MLKSMTGYGRAATVSSAGRFSVELLSVNRKHLEINTHSLPIEFARFDAEIKKWISAKIGRGHITVRICAAFTSTSPVVVVPNTALAKQMKHAWKSLSEELQFLIDDAGWLSILTKVESIMLYDEDPKGQEAYRDTLKQQIDQAIDQLITMKVAEGRALEQDITARLTLMESLIDKVATKAPGATERYRKKLEERLKEVLGSNADIDDTLRREVCVFADRIDIAEELTRFKSHLKQAASLIVSDEYSIGKTLEFIIQELNRETNTIGSKSSDVEVAQWVIAIKTELERIREQIQNIE